MCASVGECGGVAIRALCWPQLLRQLYAFDNKTFAFFLLFVYLAEVSSRSVPLPLFLSLSRSLSTLIMIIWYLCYGAFLL